MELFLVQNRTRRLFRRHGLSAVKADMTTDCSSQDGLRDTPLSETTISTKGSKKLDGSDKAMDTTPSAKQKTPAGVLHANRCFWWLRGLDLN